MEASHAPRVPSTLDERKLETQSVLTDFKQSKLETEARKNWDKFYMRNEDGFFKDRNWGERELRTFELDLDQDQLRFLEAGCGVGNTLFPLLAHFPHWSAFACDFSPRAIAMLEARAAAEERSVQTAVVDLTLTPPPFPPVQLCTLIFVLSSVHPSKQADVIRHLAHVLLPDASLIVRDYGLFDHAMIRFAHKLDERFYARQDGTRAYFFDLERLRSLFETEGFETIKCEYLHGKTTNHQKELSVDRVFIQGHFRKIPRS